MKDRVYSCIYCGKTDDLSKSDIIPDALTNAKIINPNVCRIDHNNKFSEAFEYKIIKGLAYITNRLDIKSSKAKRSMPYKADIIIEDTTYTTSMSSDADLLHNIISTKDNKTKLGPTDRIENIAQGVSEKNKVQYGEIDINQQTIEKKVSIQCDTFVCSEMHRLITKLLMNGIAYIMISVKSWMNLKILLTTLLMESE